MRRKKPVREAPTATVPAVLRLGRCAEVWAEHGQPGDLSAWTRYGTARERWRQECGLTLAEVHELVPSGGGVWSVTDPGADERLARIGATRADLETLRTDVRSYTKRGTTR